MTNALMDAIITNDIDKAKKYLEENGDPNITYEGSTKTAIILAAQLDRYKIIELLLDYGADYDPILNRYKFIVGRVLDQIRNNNIKFVQDYLKSGGKLQYIDSSLALRHAEDRNQHDMVNLLLKHERDIYELEYDRDIYGEVSDNSSLSGVEFVFFLFSMMSFSMFITPTVVLLTINGPNIVSLILGIGLILLGTAAFFTGKRIFSDESPLDNGGWFGGLEASMFMSIIFMVPTVVFALLPVNEPFIVSLIFGIPSVVLGTVAFFINKRISHKRHNPVHSVNRFDLNACFNHADLQFSANTTKSFSQVSEYNQHILMSAAYRGDTEKVKELLAVDANENAEDKDGKTALMYAVHSRNIEMVKLLLEKKADIYAKDRYGRTALMYAVSNDDIEMAEELIDKGAGISARNNYDDTALMIAAYKGYTGMVELLLEKGAKTDSITGSRYGATALLLAVSGGHIDTVQALLENGACIDITNNHGKTPLLIAKYKGHKEIVKLLTEKLTQSVGLANNSQRVSSAELELPNPPTHHLNVVKAKAREVPVVKARAVSSLTSLDRSKDF